MKEAKPSWTAQGVAAERAVLDHLGVLSDPFARSMLPTSMARADAVVRHLPRWVWGRSITLAGLAARVLWFDARVTEALDAGITQVAIVGAGYDSRAWRMRRDGVEFFELDHPATQQDKIKRAPGVGPTYVEADLNAQDAGRALLEGGLEPARPTVFVVEGVTMYLSDYVVREQLASLAAASGPGSRLIADFHPPRELGTRRNKRQHLLQRFARTGTGEGFVLTVDRPQALEIVTESGWEVADVINMREAAQSLLPPRSGLPVGEVNEHKTMVVVQTR